MLFYNYFTMWSRQECGAVTQETQTQKDKEKLFKTQTEIILLHKMSQTVCFPSSSLEQEGIHICRLQWFFHPAVFSHYSQW